MSKFVKHGGYFIEGKQSWFTGGWLRNVKMIRHNR